MAFHPCQDSDEIILGQNFTLAKGQFHRCRMGQPKENCLLKYMCQI